MDTKCWVCPLDPQDIEDTQCRDLHIDKGNLCRYHWNKIFRTVKHRKQSWRKN